MLGTETAMEVEQVPAHLLQRHPRNPRIGELDAIKDSIVINGWHGVVVAQRSTGYLLVGNHRWDAAASIFGEGWSVQAADGVVHVVKAGHVPGLAVAPEAHEHAGMLLIPTHWRDVDEVGAIRILLADNRTSDLAVWNEPELLQMLLEAEDLTGTGFNAEFAEQLNADLTVAPVKGWNNTPEHNLERYLATDMRQVTMITDSASFGPIIETFSTIMERDGLETHTEVLLHLIGLDPAGADLAERIAAARVEATASAQGDAQEGASDTGAGSGDGE